MHAPSGRLFGPAWAGRKQATTSGRPSLCWSPDIVSACTAGARGIALWWRNPSCSTFSYLFLPEKALGHKNGSRSGTPNGLQAKDVLRAEKVLRAPMGYGHQWPLGTNGLRAPISPRAPERKNHLPNERLLRSEPLKTPAFRPRPGGREGGQAPEVRSQL